MAKWAHAYPQVEPGAPALVNAQVVAAPASIRVGDALRLARSRQARALALGGERWALREDLARASALGLEALPAVAVARPLTVVDEQASEVSVRRRLASGTPLVVVRGRRGVLGAVTRVATSVVTLSLAPRLVRWLSPGSRELLATVGRLAVGQGGRAFAVGGLVRDVLREGTVPPRDLDVVVEGDGLALARALAAEVGGSVVEHERFLTASVQAADGARVDVATARVERYERPGALPRVMPATIGQDLERRDFTVNAMAVELASGGFGLLDPAGGARDLARGRLVVLHPLSFVEDPTRMFRAARYGARLGFPLDAWTAEAQALALRLAPYPALSGQRLAAELALVLGDVRPEEALRRLGRAGVFRLLDPRYRFTRATAAAVASLPATLARARQAGVPVEPFELAALVLVADQPREVAAAAVRRLGLSGEPLTRLLRALERGETDLERLGRARAPSERAAVLRERAPVELARVWGRGEPRARAAVAWYVAGGGAVQPELRGEDVIALGVSRGPAVAEVLRELRDGRLDGRLADRDAEVAYVRSRAATLT